MSDLRQAVVDFLAAEVALHESKTRKEWIKGSVALAKAKAAMIEALESPEVEPCAPS